MAIQEQPGRGALSRARSGGPCALSDPCAAAVLGMLACSVRACECPLHGGQTHV